MFILVSFYPKDYAYTFKAEHFKLKPRRLVIKTTVTYKVAKNELFSSFRICSEETFQLHLLETFDIGSWNISGFVESLET